jgi:hypothetical protein
MDHAASAGTKDLARLRRRRSCTPPRFSSTLLALAKPANGRERTKADDRIRKREIVGVARLARKKPVSIEVS